MADDAADDAEGNDPQDDNRLYVAAEGDGQQRVDDEHRQPESTPERLSRVAHLGLRALEGPGQAGELCAKFG